MASGWRYAIPSESFRPRPLRDAFMSFRPNAILRESVVPSLEAQARRLNHEVRQRFEALSRPGSDATQLAASVHHKLLVPALSAQAAPSKRKSQRALLRTHYELRVAG